MTPGPARGAMRPSVGRRLAALAIGSLWLGAPVAAGAEPTAASSAEPAAVAPPDSAATQRWSSFLPLMKEEALSRGYELPLPFGAGLTYLYMDRRIVVTDVRVGVNGEPPQSVSNYLDLGSRSWTQNANLKLDAWLLPFLNLYALVGYVYNRSTTHATVTAPKLGGGSRTFEMSIPTTLDGLVGGLGLTVAAGYQAFFLAADANYAQTDLGFDDRFHAGVVSIRSGWNGKVSGRTTQIWLGGTKWSTANTAKGTQEVPGVGTVHFEADQGPLNDTNADIGTSVFLSPGLHLFVDYGFNFDDVQTFIGGLTYRM